jgi:RNA methyltransferase, TrmH family
MVSKSQIGFIKSLHQKKSRYEHRLFLAEGVKVVTEILNSDFTVRAVYATQALLDQHPFFGANVSKNIEINNISVSEMERISALSTTPEVLAIVEMAEMNGSYAMEKDFYADELVLMLDDIRDPGNMGTIIRIADWFGIKKIVCSETSVELYNPKVVQATMGSLVRVDVYEANLKQVLQAVKGIPVYGALLEGRDIYRESLKAPGALLLGNESHGISNELIPFITHPISIPRFGGAESLNVAIATAVICSEFRRSGM